jgi:hypothetical protein
MAKTYLLLNWKTILGRLNSHWKHCSVRNPCLDCWLSLHMTDSSTMSYSANTALWMWRTTRLI